MSILRTPWGHIFSLPPRRVSLGESPGCDVPIAPGHAVAGVHLHLQPWESGYFLEDAASGLGTLVNGSPVTWAPLKHGDVISAGGLTLVYEEENCPPPAFPDRPAVMMPAGGAGLPHPPAWLPAEALLPPLSPVAQFVLKNTAGRKSKRRGMWIAVFLLVLTASGVAGWWFWLRHR
jgi:hypothetical protein